MKITLKELKYPEDIIAENIKMLDEKRKCIVFK